MEENDKSIEELEKEAKYTIIHMEDENEGDRKFYDDALDEVSKLYDDFRVWLQNNVDKEEIKERSKQLKSDTKEILDKLKEKANNFQQREDVKEGKEKIIIAGNKVADRVNDGLQDVLKNDRVAKVVDSISDTIDNVKRDERVKSGVKKLKKGTLHAAESAFNGLKRVLNTDDDEDD